MSRSHGHTTQTSPACEPILTKAALLETPGSSSRLLRVPRSARLLLVLCSPERGGWRNTPRFCFFSLSGFGVFHRLFLLLFLPPASRPGRCLDMLSGGGRVAGSWVYTCFVSRRLATGVVQPAPEPKIVRPLQSVSSSLVCAFADKSDVGGETGTTALKLTGWLQRSRT